MVSHRLRMLQGAFALQIVGDAGRAQRMISDLRLDAGLARGARSRGISAIQLANGPA
jgi:hypothetical protein